MRVPCSPFRTVGEADKPGAEAKPSLLSPPAVEWERTNKIAGMPKASHRKRAFVAGFDDYSTKPLRAAVKDATDVHAALLRLGFESTPRVEDALRVKNATLACPAGVGVKRDRDG